jgi:hypothetical protein
MKVVLRSRSEKLDMDEAPGKADSPEWSVADSIRATADDGQSVDVVCKLRIPEGPYVPKGRVQGQLSFRARSALTLYGRAVVGRCYVSEGNMPFDWDEGPHAFPFKNLRCLPDQPVEVDFSVVLPDGCPSHDSKYKLKSEWTVSLLGEDGRQGVVCPIRVVQGDQPSFAPEWKRPARASVWHWGMLFWGFILVLGGGVFPTFRESLARDPPDTVGAVMSGLFCLVAFLAPELLFRFYTRLMRLLWLPIKAVLSLATGTIVCLDPAAAAKGVAPGIREVIEVRSSLQVLRASVRGLWYWSAGGTWQGSLPRRAEETARRFSVPVHFEGKQQRFSAPLADEVWQVPRAGRGTEHVHRLTVELPADVPFSYVKGAEGFYWELVLRGSLFGIPLLVRHPLRVVPAGNRSAAAGAS